MIIRPDIRLVCVCVFRGRCGGCWEYIGGCGGEGGVGNTMHLCIHMRFIFFSIIIIIYYFFEKRWVEKLFRRKKKYIQRIRVYKIHTHRRTVFCVHLYRVCVCIITYIMRTG